MAVEEPFGPEVLVQLKEREEALRKASRLAEKATAGGFDVGVQKKQITELQQRLIQIKRTFFPGQ